MLELGARAAADILRDSFGIVIVDKALNPLDPKDFLTLSKKLGDQLNNVVEELQAPAIRNALKTLDVDWVNMDEAAVSRVVREANKQMLFPNKKIAPRVDAIFQKQGDALIKQSKEAAIDKFKLPISATFGAEDKAVRIFVVNNQANFITDALGNKVNAHSNTVREIVSSGVSRGLGRRDIAQEIFESYHGKPGLQAFGLRDNKFYFEVVAASFVNRGRTAASMAAFQQAGVEFYIWDSVLDEVTTETCRFMHNKRFRTSSAMAQIGAVADSPDDIKTLQPWVRSAFDAEGNSILVAGTGANRFTIATVTKPAAGQLDQVGQYNAKLNDSELMEGGMGMPPIHGLCRSTVVADPTSLVSVPKPPIGATVAPAVPPAKVPKIPAPLTAKAENAALKKLSKWKGSGWDDGHVFHKGIPMDLEPEFQDLFSVQDAFALEDAGKYKIRKPKREDVFLLTPEVSAPEVKAAIKDYKNMLAQAVNDTERHIVMAKYKGRYYVIDGDPLVVAMRLRGERRIVGRVIDLDKLKPKVPTPAIVKPKAAKPTKPIAPPANAKTHEVILFENTAPARGSNKGGFYRGSDGVNRYVKFYDDPTQAASEHLANEIYRELGLESPVSQVFKTADGKLAYASEIFEGGETLSAIKQAKGTRLPFKTDATNAMDGFVGDVLTGNWDAAGLGHDNMMRLANGKLARIDNGGTFLFRAQQGRKPTSVLNSITEWDKFLDVKVNPEYAQLAQQAGFDVIASRKAVIKQIDNVIALEKRSGGWGSLVDRVAPELPTIDRKAIVDMLEARTKLLKAKRLELKKFKPPKPGDWVFKEKPVGGVKPRKGLRVEDLPERDLPVEWKKLEGGRAQEGITQAQYRERVEKSFEKLSTQEKAAITDFTGGGYIDVRASETTAQVSRSGRPGASSNAITKGLAKLPGTNRTAYRGIGNLSGDTAPSFLEHDVIGLGKGNTGATTSLSRSPDVAIDWGSVNKDPWGGDTINVFYRLNTRTGVAVENISLHRSELEIMVSRNSRFRVTGLSRVKGTKRSIMIEADEIVGKELEDFLAQEAAGITKAFVIDDIRKDDDDDMPPAFVDHGGGRITIRGKDIDDDWPDEIVIPDGVVDVDRPLTGRVVKLTEIHKLTRKELVVAVVDHPVFGMMRPWRYVGGVGV